MKSLRIVAIMSCAAIALASASLAQVSSKGGPIQLGSDTQSINQNDHTQVLDGRVEVIQADGRLRADHIVMTYAPPEGGSSGFGPLVTIEATGNIYYVTPESTVKGDKAVYTKASDTMVLTGDVILQQGQNVTTGNRLVSQVGAGITTMDANPTSAGKGRVRAVIYPDDKTTAKKPAAH